MNVKFGIGLRYCCICKIFSTILICCKVDYKFVSCKYELKFKKMLVQLFTIFSMFFI